MTKVGLLGGYSISLHNFGQVFLHLLVTQRTQPKGQMANLSKGGRLCDGQDGFSRTSRNHFLGYNLQSSRKSAHERQSKTERQTTLDALYENEQYTVVTIRQACVESDGNPPAGSVLDVTSNILPQ